VCLELDNEYKCHYKSWRNKQNQENARWKNQPQKVK
jgi:hypothetical protein